jgi:taurine dioxygenase
LPVATHFGPRTMPQNATEFGSFRVRPVGTAIGAEVEGLDLARGISSDLREDLNRALLEWKVLFFRDQRITSEQQRDVARQWGELEVHPFLKAGDTPEVVRFEKDETTKGTENIWHSDVTWRQIPSLGSILRAVQVPALGGDTMWADMALAYDGLPEHVRDQVDGLTAVHDFSDSFGQGMSPDKLAKMREEFAPAEHPVIRVHPETGRRTIYVNEIFTSRIIGLDPEESTRLLGYLCAQARVPEYQCRFHWEPNSIAFWDNRSTQHYAISDYWPAVRIMDRVTIVGDRPV